MIQTYVQFERAVCSFMEGPRETFDSLDELMHTTLNLGQFVGYVSRDGRIKFMVIEATAGIYLALDKYGRAHCDDQSKQTQGTYVDFENAGHRLDWLKERAV